MAEINLCPLQCLSYGGPLQPVHVGKLPAIVNGDRPENFSEQDRPAFPFDTARTFITLSAVLSFIRTMNSLRVKGSVEMNRAFDPSFLL